MAHQFINYYHNFIYYLPKTDQKTSKVILEAGCGVGNFFFPLLEEGYNLHVHACDCSARAVQFVKVGWQSVLFLITECVIDKYMSNISALACTGQLITQATSAPHVLWLIAYPHWIILRPYQWVGATLSLKLAIRVFVRLNYAQHCYEA